MAPIELLWIIPVLAFGSFIFLVTYLFRKKSDSAKLTREVDGYNNGSWTPVQRTGNPDLRLGEMESAITLVTRSLASQQEMIDKFQKENNNYTGEIDGLKKNLRELQKEYDIVLSENYSLRAKVKKLIEHPDAAENRSQSGRDSLSISGKSARPDLAMYEDTKLLSTNSLDDTAEIDVSGLR